MLSCASQQRNQDTRCQNKKKTSSGSPLPMRFDQMITQTAQWSESPATPVAQELGLTQPFLFTLTVHFYSKRGCELNVASPPALKDDLWLFLRLLSLDLRPPPKWLPTRVYLDSTSHSWSHHVQPSRECSERRLGLSQWFVPWSHCRCQESYVGARTMNRCGQASKLHQEIKQKQQDWDAAVLFMRRLKVWNTLSVLLWTRFDTVSCSQVSWDSACPVFEARPSKQQREHPCQFRQGNSPRVTRRPPLRCAKEAARNGIGIKKFTHFLPQLFKISHHFKDSTAGNLYVLPPHDDELIIPSRLGPDVSVPGNLSFFGWNWVFPQGDTDGKLWMKIDTHAVDLKYKTSETCESDGLNDWTVLNNFLVSQKTTWISAVMTGSCRIQNTPSGNSYAIYGRHPPSMKRVRSLSYVCVVFGVSGMHPNTGRDGGGPCKEKGRNTPAKGRDGTHSWEGGRRTPAKEEGWNTPVKTEGRNATTMSGTKGEGRNTHAGEKTEHTREGEGTEYNGEEKGQHTPARLRDISHPQGNEDNDKEKGRHTRKGARMKYTLKGRQGWGTEYTRERRERDGMHLGNGGRRTGRNTP